MSSRLPDLAECSLAGFVGQVGDEQLHPNHWSLGRVIETELDRAQQTTRKAAFSGQRRVAVDGWVNLPSLGIPHGEQEWGSCHQSRSSAGSC
jgi:hypothetical protein